MFFVYNVHLYENYCIRGRVKETPQNYLLPPLNTDTTIHEVTSICRKNKHFFFFFAF